MEQTIVVAERPERNRLTGRVILVLLLVTFPLLALLVLEQGRVIDAQRLLIQQLTSDSQQLSSMRIRDLQKNRAKPAAPSAKTPQADSQPQSGAAPERKSRKRHESKQAPPPPAQEYPGTRPVPVRKSA